VALYLIGRREAVPVGVGCEGPVGDPANPEPLRPDAEEFAGRAWPREPWARAAGLNDASFPVGGGAVIGPAGEIGYRHVSEVGACSGQGTWGIPLDARLETPLFQADRRGNYDLCPAAARKRPRHGARAPA